MRTFLAAIIIFFYPSAANATPQAWDKIIWNADTLYLKSYRLKEYTGIDSLAIGITTIETCPTFNCWRGYVAEWEIIKNELYLIGIYNCCYPFKDRGKIDLENLFPDRYKDGKVKADWITGNVIVTDGNIVGHDNGAVLEIEILLRFNNGQIQNSINLDHAAVPKPAFIMHKDSLQDFFYQHFQWKKVPKLRSRQLEVMACIQLNEAGKPENIQLERGQFWVFSDHVLKVLHSIRDWNTYFSRGANYKVRWYVSFIIDDEKRKKYKRYRKK